MSGDMNKVNAVDIEKPAFGKRDPDDREDWQQHDCCGHERSSAEPGMPDAACATGGKEVT